MIYTTHHSARDNTSHNGELTDLLPTAKDAVDDLRPWVDMFDAIVAQGMSGVVVAVPVALNLGKPVGIIRKDSDCAHQGSKIVGECQLKSRVLWVDDFILGGETEKRVRRAVENLGGKLVARYLYSDRTVYKYTS